MPAPRPGCWLGTVSSVRPPSVDSPTTWLLTLSSFGAPSSLGASESPPSESAHVEVRGFCRRDAP